MESGKVRALDSRGFCGKCWKVLWNNGGKHQSHYPAHFILSHCVSCFISLFLKPNFVWRPRRTVGLLIVKCENFRLLLMEICHRSTFQRLLQLGWSRVIFLITMGGWHTFSSQTRWSSILFHYRGQRSRNCLEHFWGLKDSNVWCIDSCNCLIFQTAVLCMCVCVCLDLIRVRISIYNTVIK